MPFSCAKKIPKIDQTSTFRNFRARKSFERNEASFFLRADKEFQSTANLHICFQHFNTKDIVKTLCGIKKKKVVNGALPTIFNLQEVPSSTTEREKQMISRRGKKTLRDRNDLKFPAKSPRVSSAVAMNDHDDIFPCKRKTKLVLCQLKKKKKKKT